MSTEKDGGPAFPHINGFGEFLHVGLSARDFFAGMALDRASKGSDRTAEEIARRAYYIADAMLAERAKGTP